MKRKHHVAVVILVIAVLAIGTAVARKKGYNIPGDTVVRCRDGHLFTTLWIPGASVKSIRLGWRRFQYCPVGKHWSMVTPVKDADLTEDERVAAAQVHDVRIP